MYFYARHLKELSGQLHALTLVKEPNLLTGQEYERTIFSRRILNINYQVGLQMITRLLHNVQWRNEQYMK